MFFPTPKFKMKNKSSEGGFTFVELIVTVVILGILAAVALTRYVELVHSSQAAACKYNQNTLETAETLYYTQHLLKKGKGKYTRRLKKLKPYLQNGKIPKCPGGGKYKVKKHGKVTCTISDHKR